MDEILFQATLKHLPLIHRGKVRDIFAIDDEHMLIVTTDRLSAFDVVLPTPIPGKGRILTQISNFWFERLRHIVANHLSDLKLDEVISDPIEREPLEGRSMLVRRLKALPIEAIVRGHLIGSAWKDYQREGKVCGIELPAGLELAAKLETPVFTPSSKAAVGAHDENISYLQMQDILGADLAERVRETSLTLYREAAEHASKRGIILADTKFEFGLDPDTGELTLIDEVLTPDSSRFWPAESYLPGTNPPSFDKQFVRDYLETLDWNKSPPAPAIPAEIVEQTRLRYNEALTRLTS